MESKSLPLMYSLSSQSTSNGLENDGNNSRYSKEKAVIITMSQKSSERWLAVRFLTLMVAGGKLIGNLILMFVTRIAFSLPVYTPDLGKPINPKKVRPMRSLPLLATETSRNRHEQSAKGIMLLKQSRKQHSHC